MIYYQYRIEQERKDRFYRGVGNVILAIAIFAMLYGLLWIAPAVNYAIQ